MSLVGVGGEFSLKCTNMFPAELWVRLVLNEHTTTMSQLDQCRNQQVKVKDKLEHDFCCRAVLLVWSKHHISPTFSQLRWPLGCLLFIYFLSILSFSCLKSSKLVYKWGKEDICRLLNVPGSWSYRPLDKNVWWALDHFCVLFFISSFSSPFFSNQMHHTGMCAYMYTEQFWNREHCTF